MVEEVSVRDDRQRRSEKGSVGRSQRRWAQKRGPGIKAAEAGVAHEVRSVRCGSEGKTQDDLSSIVNHRVSDPWVRLREDCDESPKRSGVK